MSVCEKFIMKEVQTLHEVGERFTFKSEFNL